MRVDIYVDPRDFEWLSCDLMGSSDFPHVGQPKQVLDDVVVTYNNVINETAGAAQQIILIVQLGGIEAESVYKFADWLCRILLAARVEALHIEQRLVPCRVEDIVRKVMSYYSGRLELWE